MSNSWDVSTCDNPVLKIEENIIRNTFLNSKIETDANITNKKKNTKGKKKNGKGSGKKSKKIKWVDQAQRGRQYLETLLIPADNLAVHYNHNKRHNAKSILKVKYLL